MCRRWRVPAHREESLLRVQAQIAFVSLTQFSCLSYLLPLPPTMHELDHLSIFEELFGERRLAPLHICDRHSLTTHHSKCLQGELLWRSGHTFQNGNTVFHILNASIAAHTHLKSVSALVCCRFSLYTHLQDLQDAIRFRPHGEVLVQVRTRQRPKCTSQA